jgi:hypothetical protein
MKVFLKLRKNFFGTNILTPKVKASQYQVKQKVGLVAGWNQRYCSLVIFIEESFTQKRDIHDRQSKYR